MAKLLYVRSTPGDESRLILSERPPVILHLHAKLGARLDGGLDLRPQEAVPSAGDFLWESFFHDDPSDPTGLRLILKRVSGPRSAQVVAPCPSPPQQTTCCVPYTEDTASPGLRDCPVIQTGNKTSRPNWNHWIRTFVDPDTLPNNKKIEMKDVTPCGTTSCSSSYKRAASEMDDEEFGNQTLLSDSSSSCYTDEELGSDDEHYH